MPDATMPDSAPASARPQELTPTTKIVEAEERIEWKALEAFYRERGIKCLNCPAAVNETFSEGAKLHKFDLDEHLVALNHLMKTKPRTSEDLPPSILARCVNWLTSKLRDKPSAP